MSYLGWLERVLALLPGQLPSPGGFSGTLGSSGSKPPPANPGRGLEKCKKKVQLALGAGGPFECVLGLIPAACSAYITEEKPRPGDSQCGSA